MKSIYTKRGDAGKTRCLSGITVSKSSLVIDCVGELDELQAWINYIVANVSSAEPLLQEKECRLVSRDLMVIMGIISNYKSSSVGNVISPLEKFVPSVDLEAYIDNAKCEFLGFAVPNSPDAATFNIVRTVCRRAERSYWAWLESLSIKDNGIGVFLNRVSDYLFVRMLQAQR